MFQKIFPSVFFLLFFVVSIQAQKIGNKKYINEVHKVYSDKLQLNKIQHKKFKEVLKKFNPIIAELIDKKSSDGEINKLLKIIDLEIYKFLDPKQFKRYKKLKKKLEPQKEYRIDL